MRMPLLLAAPFLSQRAEAHVKWFAPYIVGAPPAAVTVTLRDPWFWTALALVLVFFLATRGIEMTRLGAAVTGGLDRATAGLWARMDDFVRAVTAASSRSSRWAGSI